MEQKTGGDSGSKNRRDVKEITSQSQIRLVGKTNYKIKGPYKITTIQI